MRTSTAALAAMVLAGSAGIASAQQLDEINGLWKATLDGKSAGAAQTESYPGVGITIRFDGKVVRATQSGTTITSTGIVGMAGVVTPTQASDVTLTTKGLDTPTPNDDAMSGTWFGHQLVLERDLGAKKPIDLTLPGDRPWVRFLREVLIPKTAQDRDSYHRFSKLAGERWLKSTQLGATGYWIHRGWIRDQHALDALCSGMNGTLVSPRRILKTKFSSLVQSNMRSDKKSEAALAMSSLGMYFSTAAGGAVRIHVTDDSTIYFITDRRASSLTGLVVMATPLHKPLASSFGKWQNDAGDMAFSDDEPYIRGVVETMTRASTDSFKAVSSTGRSAFTDYLGIMSIEDLRGVMFGDDSLDWGRNMTQASWDIAIIRALSHGQLRKKPKWDKTAKKVVITSDDEPASQVIVGKELRPGTPSYIDTLNGAEDALQGGTRGGGDCQVSGLATMETLTTKWLRAEHKAEIDRLESDLAPFGYTTGSSNLIASMTLTFYDAAKFSKVTPVQANEIEAAALAVFATIRADSKKLEAFYLANGIVKSTQWAPRASGF